MISLDEIVDRLGLHRVAAHLGERRLMNPMRDWYVLLIIFVGTVLCLLGIGAVLFVGVSRGELFVVQETGSVRTQTVDRSALRETLLFFEGQAAEFSELRSSAPTVSSPM